MQNIIDNGYIMPFITIHLSFYAPDNKSSLRNSRFVPQAAYSKERQVIKYQRQRGFHIPELGKFLKATYRRLQRHQRILVYIVLDQVVHQQQPITAS